MNHSTNPVVYFEIPVTNMERAISFYKTIFNFDFELDKIDDNSMSYFPFTENISGITGALAQGETYKPTQNGCLVYFGVEDIDKALSLAKKAGSAVLFPKTSNDGSYYVAEIEDSEGNRIGLHMKT